MTPSIRSTSLLQAAALVLFTGAATAEPPSLLWPAPGTVYSEFQTTLQGNDWRVTDPDAGTHFEAARKFLPNPRPRLEATFDRAAVSAASLLIEFWNGHPGTVDKKVRVNDGPWLPLLPPAQGAVHGEEEVTMSQTNAEVAIDPAFLLSGENLLEGTCGPNHFKWGQWGWYTLALRLQLDPVKQPPHPARLRIASADGAVDEQAVIELEVPDGAPAVQEVRFFARYEGLDENGDGRFNDWHGFLRAGVWEGHVGTASTAPWRVRWDTTWVPDQKPGTIAFVAHVRDERGIWTVTPAVDGLGLRRSPGRSVTMHAPFRAPPFFWVRNNRVRSAVVPLPLSFAASRVTGARLHLRAWNLFNNEQTHTPLRVNSGPWRTDITGADHGFSQHLFALDPVALQAGDNLLTFTSTTTHHGAEILWPGPVVLLEHRP